MCCLFQGVVDKRSTVAVPVQVSGRKLGPLTASFGILVVGCEDEPQVCLPNQIAFCHFYRDDSYGISSNGPNLAC